jgi:hypothetical protein
LEIHTLAVPACSLFQTPVTGDLRLGVSPFARAMVPGIVLAPQCSAQPDEIMEDAPSFPEQLLDEFLNFIQFRGKHDNQH